MTCGKIHARMANWPLKWQFCGHAKSVKLLFFLREQQDIANRMGSNKEKNDIGPKVTLHPFSNYP